MIRSKEDLIKALKVCQSATCDDCPYADIGCSSPLAYDALELIEKQENMIGDLSRTCQTLNDKVNHLLDNLTAVLKERAIRCKDSVPLNEDEINSASAASQRRKGKYGNSEKE